MTDTRPPTATPAARAVRQPHEPLHEYYASEGERAGFLHEIFASTAADYDRVERMLAFGTGPGYRRRALQRAGLSAGMRVLDVGVGTGLVAAQALALSSPGGEVTGVDPSIAMMQASPLAGRIRLLEGRAEALPVADAQYDFLSMGYALRHVGDVGAAFAEFFRALAPGGRVCILEITKPEGRLSTALLRAYMRGAVPLLARLAGSRADTPRIWRYYWDSIEACAPPARIMDTLRSAGFAEVEREVELGVFSAYRARKPGAAGG